MSEVVVCDLDGTLCTLVDRGPGGPQYDQAVPIRTRIEKLRRMYDQGHRIIIKTARGGTTGQDWRHVTERQLEQWGVRYHELYVGTMPPVEYDLWIDDKALNSDDWDMTP